MAFPSASGYPSLSGTYIPEIWSAKLLIKFYEATVMSKIANTEYEGEISNMGDQVNIRTVPDITINDYIKGQNLDYETPEAPNVELLIDKGKYWAFAANDVDVKQSDIPFVDKWAEDAAMQLKISIERGIFADVYSDADADNQGATAGKLSGDINLGVAGTPLVVTKDNILDILIDVGNVLDEQDVPSESRSVVLPAWMCAMLKKSDLKDASLTGDGTSVLRNGRIGMIDRLTVYMSNLLSTATDGADTVTNVFANHISALTFASQLTKNETVDNQNDFGKLNRGLQVYGYEVIKPEAMVHLYVTKG